MNNTEEIFHNLEATVKDARAIECMNAYKQGLYSLADMAYYLSVIPGFRELYDEACRLAYL